jgi:ATP-dependent DNA helicase DinG
VPTAADHLATEAVAVLARITGALPSGEERPQQDEMCAAVARAVGLGRHLVVQAGTGTGKSLAYAVPAVVSGRKVVVATATKALQDQLADKDLPSVASVAPFSFAVLKGRSNYLCVQRSKEVAGDGVQTSLDDAATGDGLADQVRRLIAWGNETETGDRAALPFEPSDRAWATVSVGRRECPGAFRCPSGGECFAERARAAAAAADLVVVNTHL